LASQPEVEELNHAKNSRCSLKACQMGPDAENKLAVLKAVGMKLSVEPENHVAA
jgi:hypothetical protein